MTPFIEVSLRDPLQRDWDEGEVMEIYQTDEKYFKFKLTESALKGERKVKVIPIEVILN